MIARVGLNIGLLSPCCAHTSASVILLLLPATGGVGGPAVLPVHGVYYARIACKCQHFFDVFAKYFYLHHQASRLRLMQSAICGGGRAGSPRLIFVKPLRVYPAFFALFPHLGD